MRPKRATIKDVASKAGVSVSAVSYVLNNTPGQSFLESTREKILKAAEELKYTPNSIARGMRTKRSGNIGLVSFWDVTDHVFNEILNGVSKISDMNNYTIVFCNLNSKSKGFNYVDLYNRQQIDGIIFISPYEIQKYYDENAHVSKIKENKIPAVIINAYTQDDSVSCIYIDYYNTTYMAAEYLIHLGHRRLGYLMPCSREFSQMQANERLKGFNDALKNNNLPNINEFIFGIEDLEAITEAIRKGKGPTGIVANKTDYAHKFLKCMLDKGIKVPEQVSVIAANTGPASAMLYPPLTTIQLPLSEIGERGAQMLCDIINKKGSQTKLKLPNRICERESCRKIE